MNIDVPDEMQRESCRGSRGGSPEPDVTRQDWIRTSRVPPVFQDLIGGLRSPHQRGSQGVLPL